MSAAHRKLVLTFVLSLLIAAAPICDAKRALSSSNRKTSSGGGYSTRRQQSTSVTKPSYNTNGGSSSSSNSHADVAKLSYPNYNSQPNRPASAPTSNNQPIGWNVPNQANAGPPPAYSASNVPGGARTNVHEPPPAYQKPNYGAAPPSYNQATGANYGGAPQYHNPGSLPPGAQYYNNPSQIPGGYHAPAGYPAGGYHPPGGVPAGATYYPSSQSLPQGASYIPAGSSLPAGAIMYSSPPQQTSSGLGFGSGIVAGTLGGALLGHLLTPTQTRVEQAPAASGGSSDGGHDRIIIINNNGEPVNATNANGVTVINNAVTQAPAAAVPGETPAPLAPMSPVPAGTTDVSQNSTNPAETPLVQAAPPAAPIDSANPPVPANPEQPPPGGIICVPVRINETDPTDATKMVEVEKIACYPAPPPPPQPQPVAEGMDANKTSAAMAVEGSAPLAPMQPLTPGASAQQLQHESTMVGDQTLKSATDAAGHKEKSLLVLLMCFASRYLVAYN